MSIEDKTQHLPIVPSGWAAHFGDDAKFKGLKMKPESQALEKAEVSGKDKDGIPIKKIAYVAGVTTDNTNGKGLLFSYDIRIDRTLN